VLEPEVILAGDAVKVLPDKLKAPTVTEIVGGVDVTAPLLIVAVIVLLPAIVPVNNAV
jgi:hypothetical protein